MSGRIALSGEPITDIDEGRPLFLRTPDSRFDLATFVRTQLYAALATLRIGMDVLQEEEGVRLQRLFAHGGLFHTERVAQRYLAAALNTPVSVGVVAARGGAWGIAVLASYALYGGGTLRLDAFLDREVFAETAVDTVEPSPADVAGFEAYVQRFSAALPVEIAARDWT